MNRFNIEKYEDGSWIFQKDGINLIVDGYEAKDDKHWIINPEHAISYFVINGHLYGISNQFSVHRTIEDFFAVMKTQFDIFSVDKAKFFGLLNHNKTIRPSGHLS